MTCRRPGFRQGLGIGPDEQTGLGELTATGIKYGAGSAPRNGGAAVYQ